MLVECSNRNELTNYIKSFDDSHKRPTDLSSTYYLIKDRNGVEEVLYFSPFMTDMYESPCVVYELAKMEEHEIEDFVREMYEEDAFEEALAYEKTLNIDGVQYDIDNPQALPFLEFPCTIEDVLSDRECVEWFLKNKEYKID